MFFGTLGNVAEKLTHSDVLRTSNPLGHTLTRETLIMFYNYAFVASAYQGTLTILLTSANETTDGTRFLIWNPVKHDKPTLRGSQASGKPNGGFGKIDLDTINAACEALPAELASFREVQKKAGQPITKWSQMVGHTFTLNLEVVCTTSDEITS